MLFLILLFSVAIGVLSDNEHGHGKPKPAIVAYFESSLQNCEFNSPVVNLLFDSFGIVIKGNFTSQIFNSNKTNLIEEAFSKYETLRLGDQIKMVKKELPALKEEIDQIAAFIIRDLYLYMFVVKNHLVYVRLRIVNRVSELNYISYDEALYLVDQYDRRTTDFVVNMTKETPKSVQETIKLFDGSKLLNLKLNYEYVQNQSRKWIQKCIQNTQSVESTKEAREQHKH